MSISTSKDADDSYSSTLTRRGSTRAYGGEAGGSTKTHGGDSDPRFSTTTRTYGGRSRLTSESDKSNGPTYSRFQTHVSTFLPSFYWPFQYYWGAYKANIHF